MTTARTDITADLRSRLAIPRARLDDLNALLLDPGSRVVNDILAVIVRYGTRWESTRKEEGPDGTTFVLGTTSGEYRTQLLVLAVGVAEPWSP